MTPAGLPHSDTPGSTLACSSPRLFAACHVLHRRLVPRHPPYALIRLTHKLPSSTAIKSPPSGFNSPPVALRHSSIHQKHSTRPQALSLLLRRSLLSTLVVKKLGPRIQNRGPIPNIEELRSEKVDG